MSLLLDKLNLRSLWNIRVLLMGKKLDIKKVEPERELR